MIMAIAPDLVHGDELLARLRVLAEQRQVGRAPGDGLEQVDDAFECLFRDLAVLGDLLDELWHEPLEQLSATLPGRLQRTTFTQSLKQLATPLDIKVADLLQDFRGITLFVLPKMLQA